MQKTTIVTAYYNRKPQFIQTLKSISQYKNYEIIVVDDCSDEDQRLEDLVSQYPIKLIRLESKDKWYINPAVPFNIGIKAVSEDTDIVILQNPECYHKNDILSYVDINLSESNYLTFGAYSLNKTDTKKLNNIIERPKKNNVKHGGWLNHSIYRPSYFHFCSAITKNNLDLLGGFDEKYALGIGYEDNDFVRRARNLGLKIDIVDNVIVYHQYHNNCFLHASHEALAAKNKELYYAKTK